MENNRNTLTAVLMETAKYVDILICSLHAQHCFTISYNGEYILYSIFHLHVCLLLLDKASVQTWQKPIWILSPFVNCENDMVGIGYFEWLPGPVILYCSKSKPISNCTTVVFLLPNLFFPELITDRSRVY